MKTAKNAQEALNIQERYKNHPHGLINWRWANVCMDVHCRCGAVSHADFGLAHYIECIACGAVYLCNGHVELIELEQLPSGRIVRTDLCQGELKNDLL